MTLKNEEINTYEIDNVNQNSSEKLYPKLKIVLFKF